MKHQYNDLDNRKDFEEPGIYSATIIKAENAIAQDSGNEIIKLRIELDDSKVWIFENLTFGARSAWRVDTFLKSVGKQPAKGEEIDIIPEELVGLRLWVKIKIEEYKGKTQNKVDQYVTDKGLPPAIDADKAETPAPDAPTPTEEEAKKPVEDTDDLPF